MMGLRPASADFQLSNFETPESMIADPDDGSYYVSNVNGDPTAKDGNGYLSKIDSAGNVVIQKFIGGKEGEPVLDAPKGLALVGRTLYVTDIDRVKGFDKETGKPVADLDLTAFDVKYLNDLAADARGVLFVSDMLTDKILRIDTGKAHEATLFKAGQELGGPNGLWINPKNKNIMVATWRTGQVLEIDRAGRTHVVKRGLAALDGIDGDAEGNIYVSSYEKGEIYRITRWGRGVISTYLGGLDTPADLSVDAKKQALLIPSFKGNSVSTVSLIKQDQ